jgi:hypothetical protein
MGIRNIGPAVDMGAYEAPPNTGGGGGDD